MPAVQPLYELMQEQWGTNVRTLRGDRSQTWLAGEINVDQTTISRIERGVYRLTPELMLALAAALDEELHRLFPYPRGYVAQEQLRLASLRKQAERDAAVENVRVKARAS